MGNLIKKIKPWLLQDIFLSEWKKIDQNNSHVFHLNSSVDGKPLTEMEMIRGSPSILPPLVHEVGISLFNFVPKQFLMYEKLIFISFPHFPIFPIKIIVFQVDDILYLLYSHQLETLI